MKIGKRKKSNKNSVKNPGGKVLDPSLHVSVLILTKNEETDLPGCLESVQWSDDIHVYDSYSTDQTVAIARSAGAKVTRRLFDDWSSHQNWGLKNIRFKHPWVLALDADERSTPELLEDIRNALENNQGFSAYRIQIRYYFLGRWLRHAQTTSLFVRLFRPEKMKYERLVNPVPIVDGQIGRISGPIKHFPFNKGISFWFERHNSYSTLEALEILRQKGLGAHVGILKALTASDYHVRRYHQKQLFYRLPARPLVKFVFLYIIRRGFLDGVPGFVYCVLQSIYEYMIVLKVREFSRSQSNPERTV